MSVELEARLRPKLESRLDTSPPANRSRIENNKPPVFVIEPEKALFDLQLHELFKHRELIALLGWRDIAVRYKQTFIGAAWALIQPVGMMLVFSIVFRRWAHMPSEGVAYPLFAYVGLLIWQLFGNSLSASAGSLLRNAHILTKVRFPRLVIPIASVLLPLADFMIAFVGLMGVLCYFGVLPSARWLIVPGLVLQTILLALAAGLWLSALSVKYRDLSQCIPFLMQLWMFASPIVYPSDLVSWRWRALYSLNPMVSITELLRWALLGAHLNFDVNWQLSITTTLLLLISGIVYFQRIERTMADHI